MQAVPIVFAVALAVLTVALVMVGVQVMLTMSDVRKTLKKLRAEIEKNGLSVEAIESVKQIGGIFATEKKDAAQNESKQQKKRAYVRKTTPGQFKGT